MGILDNILGRGTKELADKPRLKTGVKRNNLQKEYGNSGTKVYSGLISDDYNTDFNGNAAIRIYEEMRRGDATVSAALKALKLPIIQTEYLVHPVDEDDKAEVEKAEFIRMNIEEYLEGGFIAHVKQALTCLDFGFSYFEKVYQIKDGKICLKKLAPRLQTAHYSWEMQSNNAPGVTQLITSDTATETNPEIPMEKLVLYTNDREGDNYAGISILRPAYKHWYIKDALYKIDGIKHERGAGILTITLPESSNPTDKADAEEMGENFKLNEQAYIVKHAGWDVEMMTAGIESQSAALMKSVEHHDLMIVKNILAQFLNLGAGKTGSYSLSKDQSEFFTLAIRAVTREIQHTFNKYVVRELIDLNYGPQKRYPEVRFNEVGEIDYGEMATALKTLSDGGLVKKNAQLMIYIHKIFGLPEVTLDDFEDDEFETPEPIEPEEPEEDEEMDEDPKGQPEAELAERTYFRKLEPAEERVAFAEVNDFFDEEEELVTDALAGVTDEQKEKLLKDAERILDAGDIAAIATLTLPATVVLKKEIEGSAKTALEKGKATAAKEVTSSIPTTKKVTKRVISAKTDAIIAEREFRALSAVKAQLLSAINNNLGKNATLLSIGQQLDKVFDESNRQITGNSIADFFNEGRGLVFEDMKASIHGLQRSEVLDSKTCNMCMSIDGRVLDSNDPFAKIGPVHTNCRGLWVAILKTDAKLPPVKQLPKSIRSQFETVDGVPDVNKFKQLKKPLINKTSRAGQKIEDGTLEK